MTQWDFQNKEKSGWTGIKEFFCFGRPTALFASQCNLFRAMWPDPAKGLFYICHEIQMISWDVFLVFFKTFI